MSNDDLIARLRQQWAALDPVDKWRADIAEAIETIEALRAELARLKAALSWLDRWIGHKSLKECADKVRDALAGKKVTP